MNDLLKNIIKTYGEMELWSAVDRITVVANIDGINWQKKGHPGLFNNTQIEIYTKAQFVRYIPIDKNWYSTYEPNLVRIFNRENNTLIEELYDPRQSFTGFDRDSKWTLLQAVYFASYAMWNYFNIPFVFMSKDYNIKELDIWSEEGIHLRRIQVTFPDYITTHNKQQIFYINENGLIVRHDYNAEIMGKGGAAHYLNDYTEIDGLMFPMKRRVFKRLDDNNTSLKPEPLLISIDINDLMLK